MQNYGQPPLYAKTTFPTQLANKRSSPNRVGIIPGRERKPKFDWKDVQDLSTAFHISIAWTLESPTPELKQLTRSLVEDNFKEISSMEINISEIKAKVGNVVTNLQLRTKALEGKGLFSL